MSIARYLLKNRRLQLITITAKIGKAALDGSTSKAEKAKSKIQYKANIKFLTCIQSIKL